VQQEPDQSEVPAVNGFRAKASDKVREFGVAAKERAEGRLREIGSTTKERAEERLREIGDRASEEIEGKRARIANRVEVAAESLMEHAEHASGLKHEAEEHVAHGMEAAADYLHGDMGQGHQGFLSRHPLRALLICAIAGFVLIRLLR